MLVQGGANGETTGGIYDLLTDSWTATATAGALAGRSGTRAFTGSRLINWGGLIGSDPTNVGGIYNPRKNKWTATATTNATTTRRGGYNALSAIWTGSKMIVWGGYNDAAVSFLNTARASPAAHR